jgi:hypothetical protein
MGFRAVRGCWLLRPGLRLGSLGAEREGAPTGARAERAHLSNSRIDGRTDRDRKKKRGGRRNFGTNAEFAEKEENRATKKTGGKYFPRLLRDFPHFYFSCSKSRSVVLLLLPPVCGDR